MTRFDVKIYFDTVCPWCYIGEKTFHTALALYRKTYPGGCTDEFAFTFHPYYLRADDSKVGVPMLKRIAIKNGEERVNAITTRLNRVGRDHGILFDFQGKVGNTRDSHRLIYGVQQCEGADRAQAVVTEIFGWHMERGGDITDLEGLVEAAVAVGVSREKSILILRGDEGAQEVDRLAAEARESGVSAVPTYEINGKRIEGAEDVSAFYEAFVEVKTAAEI